MEKESNEIMLFEIIKRLLKKKEIRFVFVGVLNTIFTYFIYVLLIYFRINHLISIGVVYIIGIISGYIMNKFFTFESKGKIFVEFFKYLTVYIILFFLSILLMWIIVDKLRINKYIAGIINICIISILGWFGHKKFSFKS